MRDAVLGLEIVAAWIQKQNPEDEVEGFHHRDSCRGTCDQHLYIGASVQVHCFSDADTDCHCRNRDCVGTTSVNRIDNYHDYDNDSEQGVVAGTFYESPVPQMATLLFFRLREKD